MGILTPSRLVVFSIEIIFVSVSRFKHYEEERDNKDYWSYPHKDAEQNISNA
jgi:hypothetical protein